MLKDSRSAISMDLRLVRLRVTDWVMLKDFHFVRGLLTVIRWVIVMGWRWDYYSPPQQPRTFAPVSRLRMDTGKRLGFLGLLGLGCRFGYILFVQANYIHYHT